MNTEGWASLRLDPGSAQMLRWIRLRSAQCERGWHAGMTDPGRIQIDESCTYVRPSLSHQSSAVALRLQLSDPASCYPAFCAVHAIGGKKITGEEQVT